LLDGADPWLILTLAPLFAVADMGCAGGGPVLLEEEVEEKNHLMQITLLPLLPVSDVDEVYQQLQELESFVPDLKEWRIKKDREARHFRPWPTTSTSNPESKIGN
jgi:hypothetical protein